jgi:hypothetical protein
MFLLQFLFEVRCCENECVKYKFEFLFSNKKNGSLKNGSLNKDFVFFLNKKNVHSLLEKKMNENYSQYLYLDKENNLFMNENAFASALLLDGNYLCSVDFFRITSFFTERDKRVFNAESFDRFHFKGLRTFLGLEAISNSEKRLLEVYYAMALKRIIKIYGDNTHVAVSLNKKEKSGNKNDYIYDALKGIGFVDYRIGLEDLGLSLDNKEFLKKGDWKKFYREMCKMGIL